MKFKRNAARILKRTLFVGIHDGSDEYRNRYCCVSLTRISDDYWFNRELIKPLTRRRTKWVTKNLRLKKLLKKPAQPRMNRRSGSATIGSRPTVSIPLRFYSLSLTVNLQEPWTISSGIIFIIFLNVWFNKIMN